MKHTGSNNDEGVNTKKKKKKLIHQFSAWLVIMQWKPIVTIRAPAKRVIRGILLILA